MASRCGAQIYIFDGFKKWYSHRERTLFLNQQEILQYVTNAPEGLSHLEADHR